MTSHRVKAPVDSVINDDRSLDAFERRIARHFGAERRVHRTVDLHHLERVFFRALCHDGSEGIPTAGDRRVIPMAEVSGSYSNFADVRKRVDRLRSDSSERFDSTQIQIALLGVATAVFLVAVVVTTTFPVEL